MARNGVLIQDLRSRKLLLEGFRRPCYWLAILCPWVIGAMGLPSLALPLSPGDRLEVSIPNEKYFAGVYEVNQDGALEIPYLGAMPVAGLEPEAVQQTLSAALIERGFFPAGKLQLSIQILHWAPVQVTVAGEVFQPGRVLINEQSDPQDTSISLDDRQITGNYPLRRYLTAALRAAGGVLPTADVTQIRLERPYPPTQPSTLNPQNSPLSPIPYPLSPPPYSPTQNSKLKTQNSTLNLSGAFTGDPIEDVPLIAGDRIFVPKANAPQPELARPSQITPPGIKVFISNLTIPASSNATSAIGNQQEGVTFPYGARFSQAIIAANCAGGTQATNVGRKAILVRVEPLTGETIVTERSVEELLRESSSDVDNPLLMPRDGVACYDSSVTNARDIFRTIGDIFNPLLLLRNLFR